MTEKDDKFPKGPSESLSQNIIDRVRGSVSLIEIGFFNELDWKMVGLFSQVLVLASASEETLSKIDDHFKTMTEAAQRVALKMYAEVQTVLSEQPNISAEERLRWENNYERYKRLKKDPFNPQKNPL